MSLEAGMGVAAPSAVGPTLDRRSAAALARAAAIAVAIVTRATACNDDVMMRMGGRVVGLLVIALSLTSCVIVQDEPGRRRGPVMTRAPRVEGFSARERHIVEAYFAKTRGHGGCPPGLAKKRNGCQPPGLAKRAYTTGHPLPRHVVLRPLPRDLEIRIGRPPRGYVYGVVDGDVVKLVVGSLIVIDAIANLGT